jgi:hypothetical protein
MEELLQKKPEAESGTRLCFLQQRDVTISRGYLNKNKRRCPTNNSNEDI